jgi:hypothetical protein
MFVKFQGRPSDMRSFAWICGHWADLFGALTDIEETTLGNDEALNLMAR